MIDGTCTVSGKGGKCRIRRPYHDQNQIAITNGGRLKEEERV